MSAEPLDPPRPRTREGAGAVTGTDGTMVLVTDGRANGQARSTLATVRALRAGGYAPLVTVSTRRSLAGASRDCAARLAVPALPDAAFSETVAQHGAARGCLTVLATSDDALRAIGAPGVWLLDKDHLAERARACGLRPAPGRVVADATALRRVAGVLPYPVVVKPAAGGWPAIRATDPSDLTLIPDGEQPLLVQPFLAGTMRAVAGVMWRGELVTAVHQRYLRTWPRDCGVSCYAESVPPDRVLESALRELLQGYEGIFQAQFLDGHLLDLNPRPYGSLPLAVAAGANLPTILCDLLRGHEPLTGRPRVGVRYRWVEGDVRHVRQAVHRGEMSLATSIAAIAPRPGTAHSVVAMRDPGPALARCAYVVSRRRG